LGSLCPQRNCSYCKSFNTGSSGRAGAYGCTISGAGPTCVAVVDDPAVGARVAEAMVQAFTAEGGLAVNSARVVRLDQEGARLVRQ